MIRAAGSAYVRGPAVPRRADPPQNFRLVFGRRRLRGSISPAAVDAIAAAIQQHEGYYPGSLAYQNNNPGNLVYAGQPGASPGAGGFARFDTYANGLQAEKNQITLDAVRGSDVSGNPVNSVSDLISSWSPASQNGQANTDAYIAAVALQTGYDPNAPLASLGAPDAAGAVVDLPPAGSGSVDSAVSFPGVDLASLGLPDLSADTVDLSSVGLGSVSPLWIGGGLVGLLLITKLL
jgi:hypothetical protein